ncbi:MAG: hypothetical protein OXG88_05420 [Gammaproteobacteria bacterium]|nr:hypothetical protein [Gammaproteobacteria bacterium]
MKYRPVILILAGTFLGAFGTTLIIEITKANQPEFNSNFSTSMDSAENRSELRTLALEFNKDGEVTTELALRNLLTRTSDPLVSELLTSITDEEITVSTEWRPQLLALLAQRIATSNPKHAVTLTSNLNQRERELCLEYIFMEWAQSDLTSTIAFAKTLSQSDGAAAFLGILNSRQDLTISELIDIAQQLDQPPSAIVSNLKTRDFHQSDDLSEILDFIHSVTSAQDLDRWLPTLRELVERRSETDALEILQEIAISQISSELKLQLLSPAIYELMRTDPATMFTSTLSWHDEFHQQLRRIIISRWAYQDPIPALDRVNSLEFNRQKFALQKTLIESWNPERMDLLEAHLEKFPPSLREWGHARINTDQFEWHSFHLHVPYFDNWYDE